MRVWRIEDEDEDENWNQTKRPMNDKPDNWTKLSLAARHAPPQAPREPPFGFATRIAARWASGEVLMSPAPWEKLAFRSLAFAALLMIVSVSVNYDLLDANWLHELPPADPVFGNLLEP